jgi:uncharacterized membrane protein YidH (DUF202 family)
MPDPTALGIILIAVAVGAMVLRVVAFRSPNRRGSAAVATLVVFAILAVVLGLFAWSVVRGYIEGLPN